MSGKRITKRARATRQKGKTDWRKVRSMTEKDIERGAKEDEDNPLWTAEELRMARFAAAPRERKVAVSIRLDPEVIDYFKAEGPGYQSRISAVLQAYVQSRRPETKKRPRR